MNGESTVAQNIQRINTLADVKTFNSHTKQ